MNSRERILAALHHQPVDRVPIDLGGTRQSGIAALAYAPLRKRLGLDTSAPFKVFDLYQQLADIEEAVLGRFGSDCVALNRVKVAFGLANRDWKPWRLWDGTEVLVPGGFEPEAEPDGALVLRKNGEVIARMPRHGFYFDRYEPYPGASHPDLSIWRPPTVDAADLEHHHRASLALHENTDRAVVAAMGPPYELFNGIGQGGFEDWMITFASEDDYVEELYGLLVETWLENLRAFREAVGDRVHVIQIADDLGTQRAPFLSVEMFREKVMPHYKKGLDWIHQHTPWKVVMHCDGAIVPLIPSLIEMGVDFLNPVQVSATGMDPAKLKAAFGDRLGFWGGSCDSQGSLGNGSPEEVAEEVRRNLDAFRPLEGGFVFASIHNIQANVPADNIVALFDTALAYRGPA
ncbi:MAG: methyltransferase [Puniceicoccaceae bacterium]|nr:MAG: methyltransferase [Puniceicoccaceae bacterium]